MPPGRCGRGGAGGGIADVLHGRKTAHGMDLSHLGELAGIALFDSDSQVQEIEYRAIVDVKK